jgi:hypothetical protein
MHPALIVLCAEALYASPVPEDPNLTELQIREAVTAACRRKGIRGCRGQLAFDYCECPAWAQRRIQWAFAIVEATFPPTVRARPPQLNVHPEVRRLTPTGR